VLAKTAPSRHSTVGLAVVVALAAIAIAAPASAQSPTVLPPQWGQGGPLAGQGVWVWQLRRSEHGSPTAIASRARTAGMNTVLIKSSDAITFWPQFSRLLVTQLQAGGVHVCAWQYVYGRYPAAEARLGARAASLGAECLVIDAEKQYEGHYAQASRYVAALRSLVGAGYPVALASFPYVDHHPAFPYSEFLGPSGAQYNVPQVYWKALGTTVDRALTHTYAVNAAYDRPILPLGQLWMNPRPAEIQRFCSLAGTYGSNGVSWWNWQSASPRAWDAAAELCRLSTLPAAPQPTSPTPQPTSPAPQPTPEPTSPRPPSTPQPTSPTPQPTSPAPTPKPEDPTLRGGAMGDPVVWAQEHLPGHPAPTGVFDAATRHAVAALQADAGLPATGAVDGPTWHVLLRRPATRVTWSTANARPRLARPDEVVATPPRSASLPARGDELARRRQTMAPRNRWGARVAGAAPRSSG
jgi:Putative peptidoglycan binding domain